MAESVSIVFDTQNGAIQIDLIRWLPYAEEPSLQFLSQMEGVWEIDDIPEDVLNAPFHPSITSPSIALAMKTRQSAYLLDQATYYDWLRINRPAVWELAKGTPIRCDETPDMFGAP